MKSKIFVERLNSGNPVVAPTDNWWENGVTFNSAAVYLGRSGENDPIIKILSGCNDLNHPDYKNGVVALHYRARPESDPGYRMSRSYMGCAVFTPEFKLLKRFSEPLLSPSPDKDEIDYLGVEDARITKLDGMYYATYCGSTINGNFQPMLKSDYYDPCVHKPPLFCVNIMMAKSQDLVKWEKLGPAKGQVASANNKNGVLFPEKMFGKYFLLHRPMYGPMLRDWCINLAWSDSVTGKWESLGPVMLPFHNPKVLDYKNGAGSVPISLGNNKFFSNFFTTLAMYLKKRIKSEQDIFFIMICMPRYLILTSLIRKLPSGW